MEENPTTSNELKENEISTESSISIQDLVAIHNLIKQLHKRNVFRLEELATVGIIYGKLSLFLEQAKKILNKK